MPFKKYLAGIGAALKQGNATEHTYRPALKTLLESLAPNLLATNEPKRIQCGAPDYIVTRGVVPLGYVEAKDVGLNLDDVENSEQLKRYRASLRNLILTDYLEFRLYRNGELTLTARLAKWQKNGVLKAEPDGAEQLHKLLIWFIEGEVSSVASPKELAQRMAMLARMIHDVIKLALAQSDEHDELAGQYAAFKQVLINDLLPEQFADMYAQTICYGLFAARCNHIGSGFTRQNAGADLPKTNPFLRKLFNNIAGADLDERITWVVDDLAELLARADMESVLRDFGHATRQHDPVVHFYETFLGAYDPKLKATRGVYYTPEPVVDYIVRSVDAILKRDFGLADGLADASRVTLKRPKQQGKGEEPYQTHRVQILDPACGTGTFLHAVVACIREHFAGSPGLWPSYVAEHLLPRIYGFELLMAPYAVAHMKLGLQLKESGYDFSSAERLRVFLTNTLEEAHELSGLPLFANYIAQEAASAGEVKRDVPIMVVLGNPPYSGHSANKGEWIANLLRGLDTGNKQITGNYFAVDGAPLGERNPKWLNDDYVKFIRFAQWRIEQTGYGVLAFITNHGYLDNPTFRGMRQSLLQTFDELYLYDLHGNSKKKEKATDGGKDENVFDIQQGVAIGIFVKRKATVRPELSTKAVRPDLVEGHTVHGSTSSPRTVCTVHHADLYGTRASKYATLAEQDITTTPWQTLQPQSPAYLFAQQDADLLAEYEQGWKITSIFGSGDEKNDGGKLYGLGICSHNDELFVGWTKEDVMSRVSILADNSTSDADVREKLPVIEGPYWDTHREREKVKKSDWASNILPLLYRPFDWRTIYYEPSLMEIGRGGASKWVMKNMRSSNLGLLLSRGYEVHSFEHVLVCDTVTVHHSATRKEGNYVFPLWLYPREKQDLFDEIPPNPPLTKGGAQRAGDLRRANFSPEFLAALKQKISDLPLTPEDVFAYLYAVLYAPGYRTRYAEFLKRDFPRIPLTSDCALFKRLVALGQQLVELHLMRRHAPAVCRYPVAGSNRMDKVAFREGRVYINAEQYFDGVPQAVWDYHIGGYQVAAKWLKDRKGRLLSFDDLQHYQRVIAALAETIRLQAQIDAAIPAWPMQ
ncbi:MAG: type ISP restriction/modification enzyme [Nitrosomonadaceae bacterium]|nr:type ISP restriction/modification enzyme [Nitrosomonadaceae bacterium]